MIMQVDKVVVLWTANTERYSNVSLLLLHARAEGCHLHILQSLKASEGGIVITAYVPEICTK